MAIKDPVAKRTRYGIAEARAHLGELVDRVRFTGEPITIEKSGRAAVIMLPAPEESNARTDKSQMKSAIDKVRGAVKNSGMSDAEIEELVNEAVAWAREQRISETR